MRPDDSVLAVSDGTAARYKYRFDLGFTPLPGCFHSTIPPGGPLWWERGAHLPGPLIWPVFFCVNKTYKELENKRGETVVLGYM